MRRSFLCLLIVFCFLASVQEAFSSTLAIRAKAFVILNEDNSVLFSKNAGEKLPPASTVKLMTAMVALDCMDPGTIVTISSHAARPRSSRPRLRAGNEVTVTDLLHLALMKSTNSAAIALAEAAGGSEEAFVELMNRKAQEIGTMDTLFRNASGLPGTGQHTTALDLTIILKQALTYPLIREIIGKKEASITAGDGKKWVIGNTDALLWYRDDMVGGKTGFTNRAQHCFVGAMQTEKGLVYTAVLGAPSRSRLWRSTSMLVDLSSDPEQFSMVSVTEDKPAAKAKKYKRSRAKRSKKKI